MKKYLYLALITITNIGAQEVLANVRTVKLTLNNPNYFVQTIFKTNCVESVLQIINEEEDLNSLPLRVKVFVSAGADFNYCFQKVHDIFGVRTNGMDSQKKYFNADLGLEMSPTELILEKCELKKVNHNDNPYLIELIKEFEIFRKIMNSHKVDARFRHHYSRKYSPNLEAKATLNLFRIESVYSKSDMKIDELMLAAGINPKLSEPLSFHEIIALSCLEYLENLSIYNN